MYELLQKGGKISDADITKDSDGELIVTIETGVFGRSYNSPYFVERCDEPVIFGSPTMVFLEIQLDYQNGRILSIKAPGTHTRIKR